MDKFQKSDRNQREKSLALSRLKMILGHSCCAIVVYLIWCTNEAESWSWTRFIERKVPSSLLQICTISLDVSYFVSDVKVWLMNDKIQASLGQHKQAELYNTHFASVIQSHFTTFTIVTVVRSWEVKEVKHDSFEIKVSFSPTHIYFTWMV